MLEKIARVECVFWKKKLFFIKWGIIKNSTIDAQRQMCPTMFGSKCLLHSCVNDVFYIRIKIVLSQNTFVFKALYILMHAYIWHCECKWIALPFYLYHYLLNYT
jgi:hypothetical protein